jgi:hypothetical protein
MLEKILGIIFDIFSPLSVISLFAIGAYLYRKKVYTAWQVRTAFYWPQLIFDYKNHTKKTMGHIGIWYYVIIASIALTLSSIIPLLVLNLLSH